MRKILLILALAAGTLLLTGDRASAHNFDDNSTATCYAERGGWTLSSTVKHSHPDTMTGYAVDYYCCLDLGGLSHRYMYATRWWNGATTSHDWGTVYGEWCP